MQTAYALLQLLGAALILMAIGAVYLAPQILLDVASSRRRKFEQDAIQQSEIARKVAIAEAAIAARQRGETYVPPADYDR